MNEVLAPLYYVFKNDPNESHSVSVLLCHCVLTHRNKKTMLSDDRADATIVDDTYYVVIFSGLKLPLWVTHCFLKFNFLKYNKTASKCLFSF